MPPATTKPRSMWTLMADHQAAMDLLDELDGGEMTEEQEKAFESIFAGLDADFENTAESLLNMRARLLHLSVAESAWEDQYREHMDRHASRRKALENRAKRIEQRIMEVGKTTGRLTCTEGKVKGKQIVAGEWKVRLQKNSSGQLKFVENEEVPAEYCKMLPNNEMIKAQLEMGEKLPFAFIGERGEHIRIV